MPLPTLNTEGNDLTNTFNLIRQRNVDRENRTDRQVAAGQRNTLFNLQKRKAESDLSPEMVEYQKSIRKLDMDNKNALLKKNAIEARLKTSELIRDMFVPFVNTTDPTLKDYSRFYEVLKKDKALEAHLQYLPNPEEYKRPDLRDSTDVIVPKGDLELFNKQINGIVTQADSLAKGKKGGKTVTIYGPRKQVKLLWVQEGETIDLPEDWTDQEPKKVKEEKSGIINTYVNKDGEIVEQWKNGKYTIDGNPATKEQKKGLRKIGTGDKNDSVSINADNNALMKIEDKLLKTDKEGNLARLVVDKTAGANYVRRYNELAEKLGTGEKYIWKEDAFPLDKGIVDTLTEWFGKSPKGKFAPGYVKVPVEESEVVETETETAVKPEEPKNTMPGKDLTQKAIKDANEILQQAIKGGATEEQIKVIQDRIVKKAKDMGINLTFGKSE